MSSIYWIWNCRLLSLSIQRRADERGTYSTHTHSIHIIVIICSEQSLQTRKSNARSSRFKDPETLSTFTNIELFRMLSNGLLFGSNNFECVSVNARLFAYASAYIHNTSLWRMLSKLECWCWSICVLQVARVTCLSHARMIYTSDLHDGANSSSKMAMIKRENQYKHTQQMDGLYLCVINITQLNVNGILQIADIHQFHEWPSNALELSEYI